jgi:hypothetical protein
VAFCAPGAAAQAFIPPTGEGSVTVAYHVGVALNVSVPFITSRYAAPSPHQVTIRGEPSDLDDGPMNWTLQTSRAEDRP